MRRHARAWSPNGILRPRSSWVRAICMAGGGTVRPGSEGTAESQAARSFRRSWNAAMPIVVRSLTPNSTSRTDRTFNFHFFPRLIFFFFFLAPFCQRPMRSLCSSPSWATSYGQQAAGGHARRLACGGCAVEFVRMSLRGGSSPSTLAVPVTGKESRLHFRLQGSCPAASDYAASGRLTTCIEAPARRLHVACTSPAWLRAQRQATRARRPQGLRAQAPARGSSATRRAPPVSPTYMELPA